ncbi:acyltransferase [Arenimonas composti]|uniref:Acetyltransferase n=1 Tax=Arenimonas composti TR7-09 = DSM 18010 TaxID=1121013 RepID=A0A091BFI7_9GAMM|nr:acyltransferase [Arenimonas composti]KFN51433.1 hypothetical protein P873_02555 [Arenimonas composti TR7-09 = DSM 18010]
MKLVFDERMVRHIREARIAEHGRDSRLLALAERLLANPLLRWPLGIFEHVAGFLLALPIPLYAGVVGFVATHMRGLPAYGGMYVRALYWRRKLGRMAPNVFIDQGVFFAFPRAVRLDEFAYIDKNVLLMSRTVKVGRRVHIAPRVFVSGGGDFEIEDYACIATNTNVITSTEVLADGARCSGPMVSAAQRKVFRGKVLIRRDAFIGAGATLLPGVEIGTGSVVGAGAVITRATEPWGIYVGAKAVRLGDREPVRHGDDP